MKQDKHMLGFGAIPSPAAELSTAWTLASVGGLVPTPSSCFLTNIESMKISMQDSIGCCVGCTFEEIVRRIVFIQTGEWLELSWRFVYAVCKAVEGTVQPEGDFRMFARTAGANDGTYPALAAIVVRKYGVPLAKFCPNDTSLTPDAFCYGRSMAKIPAQAIADAATRKAGADVTELVSEGGIKAAIAYAKANNGGVAILRRIGDVYWTDSKGASTWKRSTLLPMRAPRTIVGGHEEFLFGYLDVTTADRSALTAGSVTIEALRARYPEDGKEYADRTETIIFWLNHWSSAWCSTSGKKGGTKIEDTDGGIGWEFLDTWIPYINELRVSIAALPPAPQAFAYHFTKPLSKGMRGADIVALQHVLDLEKCYPYSGTPRYTGYFGDATFAGVVELQEKYAAEMLTPWKLTRGTGYVGSSTLAWLQKHYSPTK